jgi:hypothetical protein
MDDIDCVFLLHVILDIVITTAVMLTNSKSMFQKIHHELLSCTGNLPPFRQGWQSVDFIRQSEHCSEIDRQILIRQHRGATASGACPLGTSAQETSGPRCDDAQAVITNETGESIQPIAKDDP